MSDMSMVVDQAFENRAEITPQNVSAEVKDAVVHAIDMLDSGHQRVAEPVDGKWVVNQWLKKAVLLYFRISENEPMAGTWTQYFDKVPLKFAHFQRDDFQESDVRVVPPATVRKGAFIAPNVVLMPSVGSCAQIGKNVHLSGGVGIGGVLEPIQAAPTIIEDNCFIGARSEIVEGVIVEEGSVISMGVYIGQSTKILDRETGEIIYGRIPPGSVVVSGSMPARDGTHSLYCAVIVKRVDAKTRAKVGINELLRAD